LRVSRNTLYRGRVQQANVLVIADDLTGAADSGVSFALRGMRTTVLLDPAAPAPRSEVFVLDTDSRHATPDRAARAVRAAVRSPAPHVFKKIDSTLRGNVSAELEALKASRRIVVCPASPGTGRTVVGGAVRVRGVPLHETGTWAAEAKAVPRSVAEAVHPLKLRVVDLATVRGSRGELCAALAEHDAVCDAETADDLRAIVAAGLALPERPIWVGAAGLAEAVAQQLWPNFAPAHPPPVAGPVLAVVGSAHPVARRQAERLAVRFGQTLELPVPELLAAGPAELAETAGKLAAQLESGDTLVTLRPDRKPDPGQSRRLAGALAAVTAEARPGLFVLTGGETARSILTRYGVRGLRLFAEVEPGVVLSRTVGPEPAWVLTKAGGFGEPSTLDKAISLVRKGDR
jgi:D-threonate/D-erythronate kinase